MLLDDGLRPLVVRPIGKDDFDLISLSEILDVLPAIAMRLVAPRRFEVHDPMYARVDRGDVPLAAWSSRSTVRPASHSSARSGIAPGWSRGSPPVTSTSGVANESAFSNTSTRDSLRSTFECLRRVTPPAATEVATGEPDKRARKPAKRRLTLNRLVDLVNPYLVGSRHGQRGLRVMRIIIWPSCAARSGTSTNQIPHSGLAHPPRESGFAAERSARPFSSTRTQKTRGL